MCLKHRKAEKRYRTLLFLVGFIFHVKTRRKKKNEKRFLHSARRQGSGGAPSNISYIDICNRITILFYITYMILEKSLQIPKAQSIMRPLWWLPREFWWVSACLVIGFNNGHCSMDKWTSARSLGTILNYNKFVHGQPRVFFRWSQRSRLRHRHRYYNRWNHQKYPFY